VKHIRQDSLHEQKRTQSRRKNKAQKINPSFIPSQSVSIASYYYNRPLNKTHNVV
jgi:hypothetical protein